MKKFYYVILSMIAIALGTLIGGVTNSNPSYFMPASRTVEKYGLELY